MKEKTKAYLAAIMDSEGCFSISKRPTKNGIIHYEPHIIFTGKSRGLANYAVLHFGGHCVWHKTDGYFHWQLSGRQAMRSFLTSILPYLFEKREQAEILLSYLDMNGKNDPPKREFLFQRIKELKKKECVTTDMPDAFGAMKTDHAYLAGVFDAEGSLSLHQCLRKTGSKHYAKFVAVTNTNVPLLLRLKHLYGGTIRPKKQPGKKCFEWDLRSKAEIEHFFLCALPYLIVKRERVVLLLSFIRIKDESPDGRQSLYDRFRKLVTTKNAKVKIQPDLMGDHESVPAEMLTT